MNSKYSTPNKALFTQIESVQTVLCASCKKRVKAEDAFNQSVSACSRECFDACFDVFLLCPDNTWMNCDKYAYKDLLMENPRPIY